MVFAVVCQQGPAWDSTRGMREQRGWAEHAEFMDELAREGFVVLGGPLAAGEDGRHRALLIVEADSQENVRDRLGDDPWPPELLTVASVHAWELLLGDWRPERAE